MFVPEIILNKKTTTTFSYKNICNELVLLPLAIKPLTCMKKITSLLLLFLTASVFAQPAITEPSDYIICDDNSDSFATFDLSTKNTEILNGLSPDEYSISYFASVADAEANTQPLPYIFTNTSAGQQSIFVRVWQTANTDNSTIVPLTLKVIPLPEVNIEVDGFMVTVLSPVGEYYEYSIGGGAYQLSSIFTNLAPGNYILYIRNVICGNVWQYAFTVVAPPVAPEQQPYVEGSTLSDLEISGTDINWYADADATQPLPETTPVVPGTTYYATQTVNGTESQTYAITIMSVSGVAQQHSLGLTAFPNPAGNNINLKSSAILTHAELYNIQGQLVLSKIIGRENTISIDPLQSGIYLLKAYSNSSNQTIKIIKQ